MLIEDILSEEPSLGARQIQTILTDCSQFIEQSAGLPLLKTLPEAYADFQKVKIRLQKKRDTVTEAFDKAFGNQFLNLRQRAVFAYGSPQPLAERTDSFYVFPINGYSYLYSREVTNSSADYKRVIDTLFEQFDDTSKATEIVTDLLKYTYCTSNLSEGISANAEIILYGIPFYYAVRTEIVPSYAKLLASQRA